MDPYYFEAKYMSTTEGIPEKNLKDLCLEIHGAYKNLRQLLIEQKKSVNPSLSSQVNSIIRLHMQCGPETRITKIIKTRSRESVDSDRTQILNDIQEKALKLQDSNSAPNIPKYFKDIQHQQAEKYSLLEYEKIYAKQLQTLLQEYFQRLGTKENIAIFKTKLTLEESSEEPLLNFIQNELKLTAEEAAQLLNAHHTLPSIPSDLPPEPEPSGADAIPTETSAPITDDRILEMLKLSLNTNSEHDFALYASIAQERSPSVHDEFFTGGETAEEKYKKHHAELLKQLRATFHYLMYTPRQAQYPDEFPEQTFEKWAAQLTPYEMQQHINQYTLLANSILETLNHEFIEQTLRSEQEKLSQNTKAFNKAENNLSDIDSEISTYKNSISEISSGIRDLDSKFSHKKKEFTALSKDITAFNESTKTPTENAHALQKYKDFLEKHHKEISTIDPALHESISTFLESIPKPPEFTELEIPKFIGALPTATTEIPSLESIASRRFIPQAEQDAEVTSAEPSISIRQNLEQIDQRITTIEKELLHELKATGDPSLTQADSTLFEGYPGSLRQVFNPYKQKANTIRDLERKNKDLLRSTRKIQKKHIEKNHEFLECEGLLVFLSSDLHSREKEFDKVSAELNRSIASLSAAQQKKQGEELKLQILTGKAEPLRAQIETINQEKKKILRAIETIKNLTDPKNLAPLEHDNAALSKLEDEIKTILHPYRNNVLSNNIIRKLTEKSLQDFENDALNAIRSRRLELPLGEILALILTTESKQTEGELNLLENAIGKLFYKKAAEKTLEASWPMDDSQVPDIFYYDFQVNDSKNLKRYYSERIEKQRLHLHKLELDRQLEIKTKKLQLTETLLKKPKVIEKFPRSPTPPPEPEPEPKRNFLVLSTLKINIEAIDTTTTLESLNTLSVKINSRLEGAVWPDERSLDYKLTTSQWLEWSEKIEPSVTPQPNRDEKLRILKNYCDARIEARRQALLAMQADSQRTTQTAMRKLQELLEQVPNATSHEKLRDIEAEKTVIMAPFIAPQPIYTARVIEPIQPQEIKKMSDNVDRAILKQAALLTQAQNCASEISNALKMIPVVVDIRILTNDIYHKVTTNLNKFTTLSSGAQAKFIVDIKELLRNEPLNTQIPRDYSIDNITGPTQIIELLDSMSQNRIKDLKVEQARNIAPALAASFVAASKFIPSKEKPENTNQEITEMLDTFYEDTNQIPQDIKESVQQEIDNALSTALTNALHEKFESTSDEAKLLPTESEQPLVKLGLHLDLEITANSFRGKEAITDTFNNTVSTRFKKITKAAVDIQKLYRGFHTREKLKGDTQARLYLDAIQKLMVAPTLESIRDLKAACNATCANPPLPKSGHMVDTMIRAVNTKFTSWDPQTLVPIENREDFNRRIGDAEALAQQRLNASIKKQAQDIIDALKSNGSIAQCDTIEKLILLQEDLINPLKKILFLEKEDQTDTEDGKQLCLFLQEIKSNPNYNVPAMRFDTIPVTRNTIKVAIELQQQQLETAAKQAEDIINQLKLINTATSTEAVNDIPHSIQNLLAPYRSKNFSTGGKKRFFP